jgi:hypothetical protein
MRHQDEWDDGLAGEPQSYGPPPHDWHDAPEQGIIVRVLRIVVPWIALIAVITVVLSFWSEFRLEAETGETPTVEPTGTVEPTATPDTSDGVTEEPVVTPEGPEPIIGPDGISIPADEPYVRVKTQGLNLRAEPTTASEVITTLDGGQLLIYLDSSNGWYKVRDVDGNEGWVAGGGAYSELVQP